MSTNRPGYRGTAYLCANHADPADAPEAVALHLVEIERGRLVARQMTPVLVPLCDSCDKGTDPKSVRAEVERGWRPELRERGRV